jgi:hypothetical protein
LNVPSPAPLVHGFENTTALDHEDGAIPESAQYDDVVDPRSLPDVRRAMGRVSPEILQALVVAPRMALARPRRAPGRAVPPGRGGPQAPQKRLNG